MPVLQFKGKSVIESYHHTVPHCRLEFDPKLSLLPKGEKPGLDGNLIIEGDNLKALKSLLPTHAGRVKCIYIDPPYNTGNEGWVYNDNLTQPQFKEWFGQTVGKEGEDTTRHDKWCCMMYPRLELLRELLSDDGSIWISIDDNEVQNLRAIADEVFGLENFVATVIWEKVYSPKSSAKYLSENHDYIVVYAKEKKDWTRRLLPRTDEQNARYETRTTIRAAIGNPVTCLRETTTARGRIRLSALEVASLKDRLKVHTGEYPKTLFGIYMTIVEYGGVMTETERPRSSDSCVKLRTWSRKRFGLTERLGILKKPRRK